MGDCDAAELWAAFRDLKRSVLALALSFRLSSSCFLLLFAHFPCVSVYWGLLASFATIESRVLRQTMIAFSFFTPRLRL